MFSVSVGRSLVQFSGLFRLFPLDFPSQALADMAFAVHSMKLSGEDGQARLQGNQACRLV